MKTSTAKDLREHETDEISVNLESFQVDVICAQCGIWRSEHDYAVCRNPHWLDKDDPSTT